MEFLSNKDVLAAFEAIVSEGQEMLTENNAGNANDTGAPADAGNTAELPTEEGENGDI